MGLYRTFFGRFLIILMIFLFFGLSLADEGSLTLDHQGSSLDPGSSAFGQGSSAFGQGSSLDQGFLTLADLFDFGPGLVVVRNWKETEITLWCKLDYGSHDSLEWLHEGQKVTHGEKKMEDNNATLVLHPPWTKKTGKYELQLFKGNEIVEQHRITFDAAPIPKRIKDLRVISDEFYERPGFTVTEGSSAEILCDVHGSPNVEIRWFYADRKSITAYSGARSGIELRNNNIVLHFNHVTPADRSIYTCYASNKYGNITISTLMRVKSKLAPLWPALGIILEALVLIVIILWYNRRQKKKEQVEDSEIFTTANIRTPKIEKDGRGSGAGSQLLPRRQKNSF